MNSIEHLLIKLILFFQYQTMECDKGEEFPGQGIQSDEECPVWVVMESRKWPDEGRVCNQRSGGSMREWSYFAIFRVGKDKGTVNSLFTLDIASTDFSHSAIF